MSQEDFRKRLDGIGAGAQTRPERGKTSPVRRRAGVGHYAFGLLWGIILGGFAVYANQSYEALFRGPDPASAWAIAAGAVFLLSLLALGVMLAAGLLRLLMGHVDGRRWAILASCLLGLGLGAPLGRLALAAGP